MVTLVTKGAVPYQPADVDFCGERFELLNKHLIQMIEEKKIISGSYCVAKDGKIITDTAIGNLSYHEEDNRAVKPDTMYGIASLTKFFTAVAIWQLVEDGKMRVGQYVSDFLEEFEVQPFDKIKVVHLLNHTSGLPGGNKGNDHQLSPWGCIRALRNESWISAGLRTGVDCEPEKEWIYCSFAYALLGEIITRVSGEFAEDYIMNHILKPCGMKDTFFGRKKEFLDRYNIRTPQEEEELNKLKNSEKEEEEEYWESLKIPGTAGEMYSTAGDIIKFGIMLTQNGWYEGKRIIGRKAIEKMTRCSTGPDIKNFCWGAQGEYRAYGYGPDKLYNDHVLYTEGSYYHEGYGTCCLLVDPLEKLAAVWFAQFEGEQWHAEALSNVSAIIWSGLK